ncbi:MAG: LysM peptidoglycan-binding domain-containing M23 family metallopeptidase [Candidatus Omnitrophica bacterium]|nr:LysM peptidoglycan-binding domain-containing M23 family metallopeptidase [Candidatus Omnitrophota bacterium]
MSYKKAVPALFLAVLVAGCASAPAVKPPKADNLPPKACEGVYHKVAKGETLWRISRNYGVELESIVEANGLSDAAEINAGQVIIIPGKAARKPAEPPRQAPVQFVNEEFIWPVKGRVVAKFGERKGLTPNKGIDIGAREGSDVVASRSGRVIFCEEKVKGFGKTVIIDHGDGMQTVYSHNSEILVKTGQDVKRSQAIARVGSGGRGSAPYLHFEIRKKHKPQNPVHYLP